MSAMKRACNVSDSIRNTGVDCSVNMAAIVGVILVHPSFTFDDDDLADPVAFFTDALHATSPNRAFPIFGLQAPVQKLGNNKEADVTATLDDGTVVPIRYGMVNKLFSTTAGGLCLAKALQSFNRSGYAVLQIDTFGRMLAGKAADGGYRGLYTTNVWSPSPDEADFKNPQFTNFQISYSPQEYVNGVILDGGDQLLALMGLIDGEIFGATATTTYVELGIRSGCSGTDWIAEFGADWENATLFTITNKATGADVPITGVTTVSGKLRLAATLVSGQTYIVTVKDASVLQPAGIEGVEVGETIEVTVP